LRPSLGSTMKVLPYVALSEFPPPFGERLQAALHTRLVSQVVGVTRKGVNGRQRITFVARHQQRRGRKVLVMPPRQATAPRISGAD